MPAATLTTRAGQLDEMPLATVSGASCLRVTPALLSSFSVITAVIVVQSKPELSNTSKRIAVGAATLSL